MTAAHPTRIAALWMIGAIASFSAMAVAGRVVRTELDTFELMFYRSLIGVVLVMGVGRVAGTLHQISSRNMGLHLGRNLAHFAGQNLWFYAITVLPLAQVVALEFTSPLWVALLAPIFLSEHLNPRRVMAAALGFAGVLIVARPDFTTPDWGIIAAALAAIGFAGSAIFTKRLTRTQSTTCILFWLTVMQALFGLVIVLYDGHIPWPSTAVWPALIAVGCAGLMAHLCLTQALRLAPAIVVMPIDFLRLPTIALIGALLYGELITWHLILGGTVIFAANYLNLKKSG